MNKDEAKIILISNLKGGANKRVPLLKISEAVHTLLNDEGYGSFDALKNEFKISRQVLQSFYKMLEQPPEIQKLINENKIKLDTNEKLSSIKNIEDRIEMANVVAGLTAFDSRDIIDYWKINKNLTPLECKKIVLDSKDVKRNIHVIIVPLEEDTYVALKNKAKTKKIKIEDAAALAVEHWLNFGENKDE